MAERLMKPKSRSEGVGAILGQPTLKTGPLEDGFHTPSIVGAFYLAYPVRPLEGLATHPS